MYSDQKFTYNDPVNDFFGTRNLKTSQLMVPITYNLGLFHKKHNDGAIKFKVGGLVQYNFLNIKDKENGLPNYSINNFSVGITFGVSSTPWEFENGSKAGFFVDMYRGTQIYEDFYNKNSFDMPGSSFFKLGLIYSFQPKGERGISTSPCKLPTYNSLLLIVESR